ncbi:hypothetical protein [Massilia sp. S19_KUP03_FR1]|uniref:hypothetical protein n=1 Tax=Massilia sp. S19_KUP03_FR1 TaxID=3025503 RepID=UPI002FCCFC01
MDNQNTAVTPFNIADFEAKDTAWLDVQNIKDDGPLLVNGGAVRIELSSPGTREYLGAQHAIATAEQAKTFAALRNKPIKETVETRIKDGSIKPIACTRTIENFPVSAQELFTNPKLGWITAQVNTFLSDWSNF